MSESHLQAVQPSHWPKPKGYANGILAEGRQIYVAGQIGWDVNGVVKQGFVAQVEQALENIVAVLAAGGAKPEDIVRMNWYVTNKAEYVARQREIGEAYRRTIGRNFPAMTLLVVAGLLEPGAEVEIEVTAVIRA